MAFFQTIFENSEILKSFYNFCRRIGKQKNFFIKDLHLNIILYETKSLNMGSVYILRAQWDEEIIAYICTCCVWYTYVAAGLWNPDAARQTVPGVKWRRGRRREGWVDSTRPPADFTKWVDRRGMTGLTRQRRAAYRSVRTSWSVYQ